MLSALRKLRASSTVALGVIAPVLKLVADKAGWSIPWDFVCWLIGAFGAKEAGRYIANGMAAKAAAEPTDPPRSERAARALAELDLARTQVRARLADRLVRFYRERNGE